jgi:hypothetical protein
MLSSDTSLPTLMRKLERPPLNLLTDSNVRVIMDVQPHSLSDIRWDAFVSTSRRFYLRVKPKMPAGKVARAEWYDLGLLH